MCVEKEGAPPERWWTERANPRVWLSGRKVVGEIGGERLVHIARDGMKAPEAARLLLNMRRILLERLADGRHEPA